MVTGWSASDLTYEKNEMAGRRGQSSRFLMESTCPFIHLVVRVRQQFMPRVTERMASRRGMVQHRPQIVFQVADDAHIVGMKHPVDSLPLQNPFACLEDRTLRILFSDFRDEQMHPDLLFPVQDDLPFIERMLNRISASNTSRQTDASTVSPDSIFPPTPFHSPIAGGFSRFNIKTSCPDFNRHNVYRYISPPLLSHSVYADARICFRSDQSSNDII